MTTKRVGRVPAPVAASPRDATLGFGKYADWPIDKLSLRYTLWLLAQDWYDAQATYWAVRDRALKGLREELEYREAREPAACEVAP
jgi:hypothetical protein